MVETGDRAKPDTLVAANVVWHQPAQDQFFHQPRRRGRGVCNEGGMIAASTDTFKIYTLKEVMATGAQVAATICLSGQPTGTEMAPSDT